MNQMIEKTLKHIKTETITNHLAIYFAVVFSFVTFFVFSAQSAFAKSYTIGLSLPLTGVNSKLANQFLAGAKIATRLNNQSNAISINIVSFDDGCNEEMAKFATQQMLAVNPPLSIVTGFLCNEPAYIAANAFKTVSLPILVAGAQSNRLIKDREREDWKIWRMSPGDHSLALNAAEILSNKWRGEPYAIVDDGTVHGRTLADDFRAAMEKLGSPPQFNDNFRPTQSTQARLVRRLKKAGVTNVFVGSASEDIAMIVKNSQELAIPLQVAGSDVLSILPFLPQADRPLLSATTPLFGILEKSDVTNPFSDELMLQVLTDSIEPDAYVYKGFAAMQIAINAIGETHEGTISNLSNKRFDTILGQISFTKNGENSLSPFSLYQWNGETFDAVLN